MRFNKLISAAAAATLLASGVASADTDYRDR